jgi:hypothetical protein
MSCTSVHRYQNFAGIFSHPEDRGSRFVRNIGVFGAHYKISVSRISLSELEDFQLNLTEMRYNILDWIQLAQGRVNLWTVVKAVKKFTVP